MWFINSVVCLEVAGGESVTQGEAGGGEGERESRVLYLADNPHASSRLQGGERAQT